MVGRPGAALGGAYLVDGRRADATQIVQDGLAAARQRGERGVEGHLLRLLGDIAANPDRVETGTSEARYRQALALAEELGLRPLAALPPRLRQALPENVQAARCAGAPHHRDNEYREMEMPF